MAEYQIGIVVGSIRKASFNAKLASGVTKLAPKEFIFKVLQIDDLPLYNQDHDSAQSEATKRLKAQVSACHGLIFATPEYNRSIPGVLKNALDHASRPYGQNAWKGKPAGIIGASPGAAGTALAQQHLRNILAYLDVPILGQPEIFIQVKDDLFDESGNIGPASKQFLQNWMNLYVEWVKKHTSP